MYKNLLYKNCIVFVMNVQEVVYNKWMVFDMFMSVVIPPRGWDTICDTMSSHCLGKLRVAG